MAAGCVVFTYEGFGPRDYLKNEGNAFVFGNNEPYDLCRSLFDLIDHFDDRKEAVEQMRQNAKLTAEQYSIEKMEAALIETYKQLIF
jgi:glycosyltransferase involved in cell wall biosynthesis